MIKLHHGREQQADLGQRRPDRIARGDPGHVIKLTTDRRLLVHETPEEIVGLVVEFRRRTKSPSRSPELLTIETQNGCHYPNG